MKYSFFLSTIILCTLFLSCAKQPVTKIEKPLDIEQVSAKNEQQQSSKNNSNENKKVLNPDNIQKEKKTSHICLSPLKTPGEVWPRIEAVNALSKEDFQRNCSLEFVEILGKWRCPPISILQPIVSNLSQKQDLLKTWVKETGVSNPKIANYVIAMSIINSWKPGENTGTPGQNEKQWSKIGTQISEYKNIADDTKKLSEILEKITEVHKLRCALDVNKLGFAVECNPIHKAGRNISLNWKTTTKDGLLADLELKSCKGKSCKKLKKAAAKLKKNYISLTQEIDAIKVEVFREYLKAQLVLPPFESH